MKKASNNPFDDDHDNDIQPSAPPPPVNRSVKQSNGNGSSSRPATPPERLYPNLNSRTSPTHQPPAAVAPVQPSAPTEADLFASFSKSLAGIGTGQLKVQTYDEHAVQPSAPIARISPSSRSTHVANNTLSAGSIASKPTSTTTSPRPADGGAGGTLQEWIQRTGDRLSSLTSNRLRTETWTLDAATATTQRFATSATDILGFVNVSADNYVSRLEKEVETSGVRGEQLFTLIDSATKDFCAVVGRQLVTYSKASLAACGSIDGLIPPTQLKLKQSQLTELPTADAGDSQSGSTDKAPKKKWMTALDKHTSGLKSSFKDIGQRFNNKADSGNGAADSDGHSKVETPNYHPLQSAFAQRPLSSLCIQISSIDYALQQCRELTETLENDLTKICKQHRLELIESSWFDSAEDTLLKDMERLSDYIGLYVSYVTCSAYFLDRLYAPTPNEVNRVEPIGLLSVVDSTMRTIYKSVLSDSFHDCAISVLRRLSEAYIYALLYRRRVIENGHVEHVITPDVASMRALFQKELSAKECDTAVAALTSLLRCMSKSTDELVALYNRPSASDQPPLTIARIVALRQGVRVEKWVKSVRPHFPQLPQKSAPSAAAR